MLFFLDQVGYMHVRILGTGAAEGFPALFCECATCRRARREGGLNIRSRASIRIDDNLQVDFPPDILSQHQRLGLSLAGIEHILVTHGHADHFCPSELKWRDEPFAVWDSKPELCVYGVPDVGRILRDSVEGDLSDHDIRFHTVKPFVSFHAGTFGVLPIEANHAHDRGAVNYILSRGAASVLLAFDTGWYSERSWQALSDERFDLIVMECTRGRYDDPHAEHLSVAGVKRMRTELHRRGCVADAGRFVTIHFSHSGGLLHSELEQALKADGIEVGYDGIEFHIPE